MLPTRRAPSRRRTAFVLAAATFAAVLTGCGSSSSPSNGGNVTITFWDDNGGPQRTPVWKHIIAGFEKKNPHIKVNYVGVSTSDIEQKYNTAIAGGNPPDVGMVSSAYLASLIAQKALVPLDSRLSGGDLNNKIDKTMLKAGREDAPDGKLYLMPMTTTLDTLYWRSDWFKAAGVSAPKTWRDFFADAGKLTDSAKGTFGFTVRGGAGGTEQLLADILYYTAPTSFFDKSGKAQIASPGAADVVQKIAKLYETGKTPKADVNNAYQQMVSEFDQGKAAMMQHNLGSYNDQLNALGADKFNGEALPVGPSGKPVEIEPGDDGPGIFASGKNQDASWEFVDFALSHQMNSYWNKEAAQVPANVDAQKDAWVKTDGPLNNTLQRLNDPSTVVVSMPSYLPQYGNIMDVDLPPLWQKVLAGKMTAKAYVTKLASEFTAAEKQYRSSHK